jgi:prephenate dehydrogenase
MKIATLTIVGVGLIGGSVGLAAKRRKVAERVIGVGRRADRLAEAVAAGIIDEAAALPAAAGRSDVVLFCTPVDAIAGGVLQAASCCGPGTLLTDAGSTKRGIVAELEAALPEHARFVGGHPLAGSEKQGAEHANAQLFEGRVTVLTRCPRTDPEALAQASVFWQRLGSEVRVMTPEEHDRSLAQTSHLPHLVAAALAGSLPLELRELAASGFRDTTRIAAGDPSLWAAILLQNRGPVLEALERLRQGLTGWEAALRDGDRQMLQDLLGQAKRRRDALGN